jgi:hypothetical protein
LLIPERPPNIDEKLDTTTSLTRRVSKPKNRNKFPKPNFEPLPS